MKKTAFAGVLVIALYCLNPLAVRAELLGVYPSFPQISYVNQEATAVTYDPAAQTLQFVVTAAPFNFQFSPSDSGILMTGDNQSLVISISVDNNGVLTSGTHGFSLSGEMTGVVNGTPVSYSGVLLIGDVKAFGSGHFPSSDYFDLLVNVTGGAMQSYFSCSDLAILFHSEYSTFTGSFATAFQGSVKGQLGPNDTVPPVITCPPDSSVRLTASIQNGVNGFVLTYPDPVVTDTCDPHPWIYCDIPSGTFLAINVGDSVTVTCYGIDAAGNYSLCSFTATAQNNPNGPISFTDSGCAPATLNTDNNSCSATYIFAPPVAMNANGQLFTATATAIDQNGKAISLTLKDGSYQGVFPRTTTGADVITFVADDGQGNTATRQCLVYVKDAQAPTILCQNQTATFKPTFTTASSCITAEFNCNAIDKGKTIWFSSVLNTPSECKSPFTVTVTHQSIQLIVDGQAQPIVIPVPDATVTFDPTLKTSTTFFDAAKGVWTTLAVPKVCGSTFMAGVSYQTLADLVGCHTDGRCNLTCCCCPRPSKIKRIKATWCGTFEVNKPGIVVGWQWAAAVYSLFATDYHGLGIKPVDSSRTSAYHDIFDAGTPELYKAYWVAGGARGDRYNRCGDTDTYVGEPTCNTKVNLGKGMVCQGPVTFTAPTAIDNCDGSPPTVTCDPPSGSMFGPGDHVISCTATDSSGNASSCSFTLTVLAPLQVVFDSPACDNLNDNASMPDSGHTDFNCPDDSSTPAIVNAFRPGCKVLNKVRLLDCNGNDVTASIAPSVTVHMDVTERKGTYTNGELVSDVPVNYSCIGSPGGIMVPVPGCRSASYFEYNLDTTGFEAGTVNNNKFFRSCVWVEYNTSPGIPVGMEDVLLESQ